MRISYIDKDGWTVDAEYELTRLGVFIEWFFGIKLGPPREVRKCKRVPRGTW